MIIDLKYGCNPHQKPAQMQLPDPSPLAILNGTPSMINILDALGAWQLARELKLATGLPGAASFKHTSPAGAAIARPLDEAFLASQFLSKEDLSPAAQAYVRARGGDRMCSFGDVAAVSEIVDESLARVLKREVSDLIIAPGYEPRALQSLKEKKKGAFLILQIDPDYEPPEMESRQIFGFTLRQKRNDAKIAADLFTNPVTQKKEISPAALETLIVATVALKYTQSNSVCVAYDGQVIGMGAGQQSRVHCTRLACDKADKWFLQQHPKARALAFRPELKRPEMANVVDQYLLWDQLSEPERMQMLAGLQKKPAPITAAEKADWINGFKDVCLSSDAFIPFRDNIDRANRSHVRIVAQAGASLRDADVTAAADEYGMVMFHTGLRLFLH
ncbi:MAG TPA: phosphoribosylaminoimidazolecarboxamide formyltransferase [bacterium]|nr:phosphoribosylaminoimidazolecarboxamide formyltransferase [bacterium]HPG47378.1 phosphoribosylaminoimidazolecarboxamide formyltransferase [bacterium]HPM99730.1 phosphoribosylaminoimidazolecarboxamide formyltransferase [bacterium]